MRLTPRRRIGRFLAVLASAFAAVTCDLVTGPNADANLRVEYAGPAVLTVGQTVDFDFRALEGSTVIEGARVRVVSSAPDVVEVQGNEFTPRLFVKARGQATLTATLLGSTLGENPPFVAVPIIGVVKAVVIDSAAVTFRSLNDTLRLRAEASDFNDQLVAGAGAGARWSTTDAAIVQVDSISGRLTARGNGTAQVIARLDSTADTTAVLVQQRLVRFAFTPVNLVLNALALDTLVTVIPLDSGGSPLAAGAPAFTTSMTALNAGIASVVRLSNTTFQVSSQGNSATATGIRVVDVTGTVADDTLSVSVGQVAQTMVITTAASDVIDAFLDTVRVRARAFDARNVEVQGRALAWTSANTSIATVDPSGLVTGLTAGTTAIQAKMDAATAAASIEVRNTPRSVSLSLDSARMTTVGDTVVLAATARNRLGATVPGVAVAWQSLDTVVAQVNAAGAVVAAGIGNTRVIASIAGGYADTTRVRVTNDPASVDIVPATLTLGSIGDSATPAVDIRNARGAALGRTTVIWRSADTTVTVTATGLVIARAAGATFVTATTPDSARADTVQVVVTNAPQSVTLNRVQDTLTAPTRTLQYDAVVRNGRNAVIAGAGVDWRSSNASVASVNPAGLVTALAVGQTLIIGEANGAAGPRADTAQLEVRNDVVSLTVSPVNVTIASVGATTGIAADPRNAVGATVSGVTPLWTTSDASVAAVDATGTVTGVAVGTATVTANVAGITASASVTVTNAPDTINIVPATLTLASIGDTVSPAVVLRNALGADLPRSAAQWSSLVGSTAQVTPDGIVVATGRGATLVSAVNALNPARRDSVTVVVTNAPASINVLRTLDSLPSLNRTIQYSADAFNARGDLIVGQAVTWTSRTPSVATVSATGLATSVGIGSTWIVGTAGTVSDSARLVVSNRAATLVLTPSSLALTSVAETAALAAVARNELGNVIASPAVAWSSANGAVASVSGAGLVTAVAVGATTVTATVDGVSASVAVTVTNYPATLLLTSGNLTLASIGDQATPALTIANALGTPLARSAAAWTSSNPNVATVSADGVITAAASGACTITATSPDNAAITTSITVTVSNAPASLTIAPAGPLTLTAIGATASLAATVRNGNGVVIPSPVPPVAWGSTAAAVTVDPVTGVATAAGPGAADIIATAGAAADTVTITVAPAPSGAKSTISASSPTLVANGAAVATITVQLKDANGNDLTTGGGPVSMTLTGTGTLSAVTNHNDGTYTATLTAPTALGSGTVSAAIAGTGITTGDPLVTYVAGPATKYLVTPSSTAPVAGTAISVSAQQADAFNNPVTTARTVTWSSTGGGSFASPTSATNAGGVATATFTTDGGSGTTHSVTATDNVGVTGTSGAIQTIAGVATHYLVTVSTASPAAGAGVTITAQLRDANGNDVSLPGEIVAWSKSDPNGAFAAPTTTTSANGAATVVLTTHTVAGTATTVTATTGGITGTSGTITTTPSTASAATTTITAGSATVASGQTTTITVQAKDANGNDLTTSGGIVTLATTLGSVGAVTDHNDGTYTATFTAAAAGSAIVTGTLAGSAIAANTTITVIPGAASQIAVSAGNGQSAVAGTAVATAPAVIVRDAGNNPVAGVSVTFTVTGGSGTTVPASGSLVPTDASGIAALTSWTLGAVPGPNTLTATSAGLAGSPVIFSATGTTGAPSVMTSTITASAGSFTAGGNVTITVHLRDAAGNDLTSSAGSVVALATSLGSVGAVTDNANGTYSAVLSSTTTGTATVTGTISGNPITDTEAVTVTVGPASAAQTTATVPTGVAGSLTTITVQAKDQYGNNRGSTSGTVAATVTGANNAAGAVTDHLDGTYTVAYTPANVGSDAIAITLDGTPIGGSPYGSVVVAGAVATFQVEAAGGGPIITQTAGTPFTIRVTARDANGNTVTTFTGAGSTAVLTSSGTMTGEPITTGAFTNGVLASQAVTITNTGAFTITATRSGGPEAGTSAAFSVVAGAADVTQSTATVPAGQAGAVTTVAVQMRDQFGNLRTSSSGTVTAFVSSGANDGATLAVTDNNDGTYTATYTPVNAGTDNIRIRLFGVDIAGSPYASLIGAGGLHHFAVTNTSGTAITTRTAGSAFNIMVTAQDASNNTVTGFNGTVALTSSGTLVGAPVTTGTFTNGVLASFSVTITSSGSAAITATNGAGAETGTSNTFTVNPTTVHHYNVEESPGLPIGDQNTAVNFNLRVTARDVYDNLVTGYSGSQTRVNLSASGASLTVSNPTANFSNGVLDPVTVSFSTPGSGVTITATRNSGSPSLTGTSNAFTVFGPASAATSQVSVSSNTVTSGSGITVTLQAYDAANNLLTTGGATVAFTRAGGASNGTFGTVTDHGDGTYSATFTGTTAGSATTIGATVGGVATTSTQAVTVNPGALHHFAVTNSTGGAITTRTAGVGFQIDVTAQDVNNNTVTAFTGTVDLTATSTISAGGGTTGAFAAGVLNNHAITLTTAGAGRTITATRTTGGSEAGTSNAFTVDPAAVASFDVEAQGGGAIADQTAGASFDIRITARDAFNNVATGFTGTVDLSATQAIAAGGGTTGAFTAGVLASRAVTLNTAGANQSVTATRTGNAETGTSNTFAVDPAAASALVFLSQPGNTQVNQPIADFQVAVQDAFGNTITTDNATQVTVAIETDPPPGGSTLNGSLVVTVVGGVATFTGLSIDRDDTGFRLQVTAAGLASANSVFFDITP